VGPNVGEGKMKMTKEEKKLREYIHDGIAFAHYNWIPKTIDRFILTMRNAIIDDCIKLIKREKDFDRLHDEDDPCSICESLDNAIAAIQSRKGKR